MSLFAFLIILLLMCAAGVLAFLLVLAHGKQLRHQELMDAAARREAQLSAEVNALRQRFAPALALDREVARLQAAVAGLLAEQNGLAAAVQQATAARNSLQTEIQAIEDRLEIAANGLYEPHYSFDTSEAYKARLDEVRAFRKQMIRDKSATKTLIEWVVGGSKDEGRKMQEQLSKLMLRAFNGECDAALANVAWNNITKMEERLRKAKVEIDRQATVVQISIDDRYLDLAVAELRLAYEYAEKKRAEQEEQRRIKEQMREEERAQRELQRAQAETAAEERRYEQALLKAREEARQAQGATLLELNAQIAALQTRLAEAHERHERAVSLAQLTKAGYVYVISNVGSFGDDVFKVGMTRRADPMDRIWELGDASVPFDFDVHAMIYTEDAPQLERRLHEQFEARRVNLVNARKEFFQVPLDQLEAFVRTLGLNVEFTKLAEAREYRETQAKKSSGGAQALP